MSLHSPSPHPGASAHARVDQITKGVTIAGTGICLPSKSLTNADLEKVMDTSDEWIVQRTGIHSRRILDASKHETTWTLAAGALQAACENARLDPALLDLVLVATMTPEMTCPPSATRVAHAVGARNAGAWDLSAACSGFVFGLNTAHALIRDSGYRHVGLVGADALSTLMDYSTAGRSTAIIFGDAAGAAVLSADSDTRLGIIAQAMFSDGAGWKDIYVPEQARDFPDGVEPDDSKIGFVQMNGASVFKFAVGTFPELIAQTLDKANLKPDDIDMYVCHQSNARILNAARERFGLPENKLYVNIQNYGNTVGASVPLCLHELRAAGRIRPGMKVLFVAFGGGLTWGSSLWQL